VRQTAEQIHRRVIQMFAIVEEAVAGATHALLAGDRERARALVANDVALDDLYVELQQLVHDRATRNLPAEIPARVRGFIEQMGDLACQMWRMAADAYAEHAPGAERIDLLDDKMDDLHVQFIAELVGGSVPVPVAIELALIGRFYERLGDHAVNLTRRVPLRTGLIAAAAADR
jgi:phosphate transport system protein